MNKLKGWILFLACLFYMGYMIVTNREFNVFVTILIGGGLGMGTMILSALNILSGKMIQKDDQKTLESGGKVPKDPTLFRVGLGWLLHPVWHRTYRHPSWKPIRKQATSRG